MNNINPLGKTYKEYQEELKKIDLQKNFKLKLSKVDDIEEVINQGFLGDFVEEFLDDATVLITKARDTVRFDMTDAYTEAEGMLNELEADIKALGIDVPADVKRLQAELNNLDKEITKYESKVKSFG
jgi:predicted RNase H-like nuclease (RuvC/YqgF family)